MYWTRPKGEARSGAHVRLASGTMEASAPPKCPPPPNPPWPPPPPPRAHPAGVRTINVMPTKLSNVNFFIFQDRHSSVLRPLRIGGILRCHARVGTISLFRNMPKPRDDK